jgi:hypothetical protein
MHGVVSLLDDEHWRAVEALWAELRDRFGLRDVPVVPFPHFSYHVAADYDFDALEATLDRFAAATPPFRVRAGGLG